MARKYLLKLEGRSTRNSAVFTQSELDYITNLLRSSRAHAVQFYDDSMGDRAIEVLTEIIEVLTYNSHFH